MEFRGILGSGLLFLTLWAQCQLGASVPPLRSELEELGLIVDGFKGITRVERPSPRYRLPPTLRPTNYTLEIQPILDEDEEVGTRFTAPGKVWITVVVASDTTAITLHSNTLQIDFGSITVSEGDTDIPVTSYTNSTLNETYTIELGSPGLRAGRQYVIYVEFLAVVATSRFDGLYRSSYTDANGNLRYLAATDFEADDARRAWPCFDEPELKASWQINVLRKGSYHSLSNTVLEETVAVPSFPGWFKDVYAWTEPLPTYLVAIAVSDFKNTSAHPSLFPGKPVTIWGPGPLMDVGAGVYAANLSAQILQFFETNFETDSKLLKMDKISLGSDFSAGAMENWGLNTYRESRLLYIDGVSTVEDKIKMTTTLSHEIAHHWFGNLVTMKWWNDIWLNEGFATYFAALGVDSVFKDYLAVESLVHNAVQFAMQADVLETTRPLSFPAETGPEVDAMFDTLTYYKGASILRMLEAALPPGTLRQGLINYLDKYSLKNAEQDDLFAALEEQAMADSALPEGITVKSIMDTWTLQSGFPVVALTTLAPGQFQLEQAKYFPRGPSAGDPATWSIPITFYQDGGEPNTTTQFWLNSTEPFQFSLSPDKWTILNTAHIGYYRVLYDRANFGMILGQLENDFEVFDPLTRSALIDESLNLGSTGPGYYELSMALDVTRYMSREHSLIPWTSLLTNLALPYRMFSRTGSFYYFRDYILALIKNPLSHIGMEGVPSELMETTLLRTRLMEWACNLGDPDCTEFAKDKFSGWMANPTNNEISPDLRPTVYCTAVANGGNAEWDFILKQVLDLVLDYQSILLPEHRLVAIQAVAGNSAGVEITFNFIRNHFSTLFRRYGVNIISGTISTLSNYMNTMQNFGDMDTFIKTYETELAGVQASLQASTQRIFSNFFWMEVPLAPYSSPYNQFEAWLRTASPLLLP